MNINHNFCFILLITFLLTACAGDGKVMPRPGVLEAKACMKKINSSPPNYPEYVIRYCTSNGVWVVDQCDPVSNLVLESYDFVNKEYTGPLSNGNTVTVDNLLVEQQQEFFALRKALNSDLLSKKK